MKITDEIKDKVHELRSEGLSYAKIVEATGLGRTSVIKIIKSQNRADVKEGMIRQSMDNPLETDVIEAKVKKLCPNPRIIMIYFNDQLENDAKCVVRPGENYQMGRPLQVKKVETSEEPLYRLA